jgi:PHD finger-like domain-containing protein 5A
MARHAKDIYLCRNVAGTTVGRLCDNCDGRCVVCDSHANQAEAVLICDECAFRQSDNPKLGGGRCIICGGNGKHEAFYCAECVMLERDRDGCPRVKNISTQRQDVRNEQKRYAAES